MDSFEIRKVPVDWKHPSRTVDGVKVFIPLRNSRYYQMDVRLWDKKLKQYLLSGYDYDTVIKNMGQRPIRANYAPIFKNATMTAYYHNNIPVSFEKYRALKAIALSEEEPASE